MKIFTLYYKNEGGGFFRRLGRMMKACADAGNTVHYMAPQPFPGLDGYPEILWHRAPLPGPTFVKALTALVLWPFLVLVTSIRFRIDRFAVFGLPYAAVCGIASKVTGRPIVTFVRSDWVAELELAGRSRLTRAAGWLTLRLGGLASRTIVANSVSLGSRLGERLGKGRMVKVLPNDIEPGDTPDRGKARTVLANMCGFCEDRFVIGYVGTFKPRKQVWQVIDIFNILRDTPSVLVLVGDGADREQVLNRINELKLQDRVYWLGWQEDVRELLAGMDVTILPSRFEGSPNAVLESVSVGTPVIGSDVMGVVDLLPTEMLFPLDDIERAAEIIRECTARGQFYSVITRAAQQVREKFAFDWDAQIVKLVGNG